MRPHSDYWPVLARGDRPAPTRDAAARRMQHLVRGGRAAVTALGDAVASRRSIEVRIEAAETLRILTAVLDTAVADPVVDHPTLVEARVHIRQAAELVGTIADQIDNDSPRNRRRRPGP